MSVVCDIGFGRSWIIILNKTGTSIDPWGIPVPMFLADESECPASVTIFLADKNDLIYS